MPACAGRPRVGVGSVGAWAWVPPAPSGPPCPRGTRDRALLVLTQASEQKPGGLFQHLTPQGPVPGPAGSRRSCALVPPVIPSHGLPPTHTPLSLPLVLRLTCVLWESHRLHPKPSPVPLVSTAGQTPGGGASFDPRGCALWGQLLVTPWIAVRGACTCLPRSGLLERKALPLSAQLTIPGPRPSRCLLEDQSSFRRPRAPWAPPPTTSPVAGPGGGDRSAVPHPRPGGTGGVDQGALLPGVQAVAQSR